MLATTLVAVVEYPEGNLHVFPIFENEFDGTQSVQIDGAYKFLVHLEHVIRLEYAPQFRPHRDDNSDVLQPPAAVEPAEANGQEAAA